MDNVVPILTGERRVPTFAPQPHDGLLPLIQELNRKLLTVAGQRDAYALDIAEGRLIPWRRAYAYGAAWFAAGAFLAHLLTRAVR